MKATLILTLAIALAACGGSETDETLPGASPPIPLVTMGIVNGIAVCPEAVMTQAEAGTCVAYTCRWSCAEFVDDFGEHRGPGAVTASMFHCPDWPQDAVPGAITYSVSPCR